MAIANPKFGVYIIYIYISLSLWLQLIFLHHRHMLAYKYQTVGDVKAFLGAGRARIRRWGRV